MSGYEIPKADELRPGMHVTWLRESRGGYGYVQPIPATVATAGSKTVALDVLRLDGTAVRRRVKREKLRRKVVGE